MQEVLEAKSSRAIPGATVAALRRYSDERAPIVVATERAARFLTGRGYAQSPKIIDRMGPDAVLLVDALSKDALHDVRYHLQKGISANTLLSNRNNEEHASLLGLAHSAAAVRLLLESGANPNARSRVMMANPLSAVIRSMPTRDRVEAVDVLLRAGADPNGMNGVGAGPLDAALSKPDIAVVMLLIDAGARVDRFAMLSMLSAHNERAHRVRNDPEQLRQCHAQAKQMVDLLVFGTEADELDALLMDKEVARLLRLTPEVDAMFAVHTGKVTPPAPAATSPALS